jgi:hypothetical protein
MTQQVIEHTLASAVATSGSFTVSYPSNTDAGHYGDSAGHTMEALNSNFTSPSGFTLTFGTASISVTYLGSTTMPSGTKVFLGIEQLGADGDLSEVSRAVGADMAVIRLGAPDVADPDGISASATINTTAVIGGALASGGVATFDVPRNVVGAWTGTATITITGADEYGVAMTETSASGTSHAGKKAFKTVTGVESSGSITSATIGSGDVLGLPVALSQVGLCVAELEDGIDATAGTLVKAAGAAATATTGDVRGTYDANSAADGAKAFTLICALTDPAYKGVTQA